MHIMPGGCTYISVVSTTHLNIPAAMTSRPETQQESIVWNAAIVKLLAKHSASSLLQVKASNNESPTIVTPIITVRLDGAGEQAPSTPLVKWPYGVPASQGVTRK